MSKDGEKYEFKGLSDSPEGGQRGVCGDVMLGSLNFHFSSCRHTYPTIKVCLIFQRDG